MRLSCQRDLVQTIFTMDHPRALRPERRQHVGKPFREVLSPHANDLPRRACRITQRPKQIEGRVNAKLPANARNSRRRAVIERRKHKADADLVQRILRDLRNRRYVHAQRRQQIRAARFAARRAIAVFRNRQTRACNHKCRRRRDVESLRATRPRPRSVDKARMF